MTSRRTARTCEADCHHCGKTNTVVLLVPDDAVFYKGNLTCAHCGNTYAATIPVAEYRRNDDRRG